MSLSPSSVVFLTKILEIHLNFAPKHRLRDMKTTFKTVFTELDDELMNLDIQENAPVDIDIDKIKSEVLMQINREIKRRRNSARSLLLFSRQR